jgi:hypothetical protein
MQTNASRRDFLAAVSGAALMPAAAAPGSAPGKMKAVDPHKNLFYCYGCGRGGEPQ